VLLEPKYLTSVATQRGCVVFGGDACYLLRPGAERIQHREPPGVNGPVVACTVDGSRPPRIAVAGADSIVIMNGDQFATLPLDQGHPEPVALAWAADIFGKVSGPVLHALFDDERVLSLPMGEGEPSFLEVPDVRAVTTDDRGHLALVSIDRETGEARVFVHQSGEDWRVRSFEAPAFIADVRLAVAGQAIAVSFQFEGVWISRAQDAAFTEVEALRGEGGAIAFEGSSESAALLGATRKEQRVHSILRVQADGRASKIGEIEGDDDPFGCMVRDLVWDETRRTLWAAVGQAGILRLASPDAPPPGRGGVN
jgi:hypothetical protein